jgi:hypothetical protein
MSALLVASLLAASAAPSFTPVSADPAAESTVLQRIHAAASKALVQVGPDPRHAGVLITESGVLLAPSAGLQVAQVVPVTFVNGFHAEADVVALDAELGVALLRLRLTVPVAFVPMGSAAPQPTQASYLLHFGRPQTASVTFARIATTRVARAGHIDERFLTAHYGLDARSRGGAVISYAGQLIGLLLTSDTSGTGFAVSTRALLNFVGQHAEVLPGVALTTTSDPSGAQLFLDGALQGNTPLSLPRIPMGEHLLALRTPGLPDTVRTFEAFGSSTQALSFVLLPGAPVTLEAPAAAELRVDGVLRANGPATLWLPGGRHVVQATQPGHRPFSRVIEVVEDRPLVLAVTMVEARATLTVDTVPPGAAVMLDDNRIGETPLLARRVSPGTYELTLARTGFHPLKIPVSIPDGQDVNLGGARASRDRGLAGWRSAPPAARLRALRTRRAPGHLLRAVPVRADLRLSRRGRSDGDPRSDLCRRRLAAGSRRGPHRLLDRRGRSGRAVAGLHWVLHRRRERPLEQQRRALAERPRHRLGRPGHRGARARALRRQPLHRLAAGHAGHGPRRHRRRAARVHGAKACAPLSLASRTTFF